MSAPVTNHPAAPVTVVRDWNGRWLLYVPCNNYRSSGSQHWLAERAQLQVYQGASVSVHARPQQNVIQISPYDMKEMENPAVTQHLMDLPEATPNVEHEEMEDDDQEEEEEEEEEENMDFNPSISSSPKYMDHGSITDSQRTAIRRSANARRSKAHVKRPRNAWLIFRCEKSKELHKVSPGMSAGKISTEVSLKWQALSPAAKAYYHSLAAEEARQHQLKYPGYRYQPGRQ